MKEIDSVLAKYGLKSKGFKIDVVSINQSGGQNAFSITNNYYGNVTVVNAPTQLHPDNFHVLKMHELAPDKTTKLRFMYPSNSKMSQVFTQELINMLKKDGYKDVGAMVDLASSVDAPKKQITPMKPDENIGLQFYVNVED
jgi:predicted RNA binding protein YcfA (HicA-like mRNA interferase family)